MAIIKCKMCGGDLNIIEGASTAECEFCGSIQTIPKVDDEKKLTLFARANRLRAACEFDKAAGIYESIVADFPEEAEAYWGLVLCKYGIEYVDDPGTGKKIPTCHRSSYDSVMDDGNFEQAMENADIVAQKVYREEAKTIERIRKGILEVSSKEQPYDIFICYKETDPKGDRTLDSVLAQDLYSALTDKGYRVFFSRITLQGKLGEAYEPYIFAALNSAKVMLAVGTCYEYYNAVWVKNEWSRYLKICEADKSKHLIPCYKNLDPEDMPKEFNHLQGADLGKMGAVQDILFNMEKYIPLKKQTTTVIQEKVVVGGTAGNKIASLLDRGNMALEDGDWVKADSFFEDVLNNDSKNAQAYLGKTLATEKCRTIDAFARKRKDASQNARAEKKQIPPSTNHIGEIVVQYTIPGYVEEQAIRTLYEFDLSYSSEVAGRQEQYKAEENYWANHKWLSKAEKFAAGTVAEHLQREKKALFAALSDRVKQAEAAEAAAKKKVEERYAQHITHADAEAEKLYNDGLSRREADYQKLLQIAKTSSDLAELTETAEKFATLGNYQDSKNLAEHCCKRAVEEQAKLDAEAERQRIQNEKQRKARQAKIKMISIISAAAVAFVVVAVLVITQVIIPGSNYKKASTLLAKGEYLEAIEIYYRIRGFKDSNTNIQEFETPIIEQLVAAEWKCEEYIYEENFDGGNGKIYDMWSQHTMTFDTSMNCSYTWSSIACIAGTTKEEPRSNFDHEYQCQITVCDGDIIITGFSEQGDFKGGRVVAEFEIINDQIKILGLHGVDTVGNGNAVVLYPYTDEDIAAEEEAKHQAQLKQQYDEAWNMLNSNDFKSAYEAFSALGEYEDSAQLAAELLRQNHVLAELENFVVEGEKVDMDALAALVASIPGEASFTVDPETVESWRNLVELYLPYYGAFEIVSGDRAALQGVFNMEVDRTIECDVFLTHTFLGTSSGQLEWHVGGTYRAPDGKYYGMGISMESAYGSSDFCLTSYKSADYRMYLENSNVVIEAYKNDDVLYRCVLRKIS